MYKDAGKRLKHEGGFLLLQVNDQLLSRVNDDPARRDPVCCDGSKRRFLPGLCRLPRSLPKTCVQGSVFTFC